MTFRPTAAVDTGRWRRLSTLRLRAGTTVAAFVPDAGCTGVSLRHRGREFLATPGGPERLRAGHTLGLPLLAPWANRIAPVGGAYRVSDVRVPVPTSGGPLHRDANGLPIHGLLVGTGAWRIDATRAGSGRASFTAATELDDPVFPFPHRLTLDVSLVEGALRVTTTLTPTGRRPVPVAFGWHPYLRVPGSPRARWRLVLPAREHRLLDDRGLPTGAATRAGAEAAPIGRRTFDDLYALGRSRVLGLEGDHGPLSVRADAGFPFAQVWVPPGRAFVALEPMTTATNALVTGTAPRVPPGDAFAASFTLTVAAD